MVQPEGHPGHADDHEGGHVDGDDVVGDLPLEFQINTQAAVFALKIKHNTNILMNIHSTYIFTVCGK